MKTDIEIQEEINDLLEEHSMLGGEVYFPAELAEISHEDWGDILAARHGWTDKGTLWVEDLDDAGKLVEIESMQTHKGKGRRNITLIRTSEERFFVLGEKFDRNAETNSEIRRPATTLL